MSRIYEVQCVSCNAFAVLNRYCRQCETHQPEIKGEINDATKNDSDKPDDFYEQPTKIDLRQDQINRTD